MYYYSIFQQLFNFIPRYHFEKSVNGTSYKEVRLSKWEYQNGFYPLQILLYDYRT